MAGTVTVDVDYLPDDEGVEIPGIGLVQNHTTKEVDNGQIAAWEQMTGEEWPSDGLSIVHKNIETEPTSVIMEAPSNEELNNQPPPPPTFGPDGVVTPPEQPVQTDQVAAAPEDQAARPVEADGGTGVDTGQAPTSEGSGS